MSQDQRLYKHVVLFKFHEKTDAEKVRGIEKAFAAFVSKLPFVVGFEWGLNSSPEKLDHGYTHCFIVSFRDEAGRDAYLPHPDHQAFVRDWLDPNLEEVCVVDFRVEG